MKGNNMKFEKPKQMIIYVDGKKVVMPFNCSVYQDKVVKIKNRFTGEETEMPGYAAAVYDTIIGAERFEAWDIVRAGLDWFKKYFPKQYMVVLD